MRNHIARWFSNLNVALADADLTPVERMAAELKVLRERVLRIETERRDLGDNRPMDDCSRLCRPNPWSIDYKLLRSETFGFRAGPTHSPDIVSGDVERSVVTRDYIKLATAFGKRGY